MKKQSQDLITVSGVRGFVDEAGTAHLKLEDVARGLGFTEKKPDGAEYVRWNTVSGYLCDIGLSQEVAKDGFIPENIFYRLAMKAKNETAERFQAKVADEILPSIRKHGGYLTPAKIEEVLLNPDTIIHLATTLKAEQEQRQRLEARNSVLTQRISEYEPKAQYMDQILSSSGTMATAQIAADYGLTAYQLNRILYSEHIQHKVNDQWLLYRDHLGKGYTKSETIPITRSDGRPDTKLFTRWTQKGRLLIHGILEKRGIAANMDRTVDSKQIVF